MNCKIHNIHSVKETKSISLMSYELRLLQYIYNFSSKTRGDWNHYKICKGQFLSQMFESTFLLQKYEV